MKKKFTDSLHNCFLQQKWWWELPLVVDTGFLLVFEASAHSMQCAKFLKKGIFEAFYVRRFNFKDLSEPFKQVASLEHSYVITQWVPKMVNSGDMAYLHCSSFSVHFTTTRLPTSIHDANQSKIWIVSEFHYALRHCSPSMIELSDLNLILTITLKVFFSPFFSDF